MELANKAMENMMNGTLFRGYAGSDETDQKVRINWQYFENASGNESICISD